MKNLEQIQADISQAFPDVSLEFARQNFAKHSELWVYVLSRNRYTDVQEWCRNYTNLNHLDEEVWILVKTWTGPWLGGDNEQEIRELQQRRDGFRTRYGIAVSSR